MFSEGFAPPLTRLWTRTFDKYVSYPIVANGLVFVTVGDAVNSGTSFLEAIDLVTGTRVWGRTIATGVNGCCITAVAHAAYDNGRIFVADEGTDVVKSFSADRNGTLLWSIHLTSNHQEGVTDPPTAYNGQVFVVAAGDGTSLWSLRESNGKTNWIGHDPYFGTETSAAIGPGGLYLAFPCQAYKFSFTGELLWNYDNHCIGGGGTIPVYAFGRVYPEDGLSNDVVLAARDGSVVGQLISDTPPAFWLDADAKPFAITLSGGTLRSVSRKTGQLAWTFTGDGHLVSAPIVINDTVAITSFDNVSKSNVFLVDARTGKQLWSRPLSPLYYSCYCGPLTGLGAGEGVLVVPHGKALTAYAPKVRVAAQSGSVNKRKWH